MTRDEKLLKIFKIQSYQRNGRMVVRLYDIENVLKMDDTGLDNLLETMEKHLPQKEIAQANMEVRFDG